MEIMQVLLLQDVDNLGLAGEAVKVRPGYGRNYLLPQKMAVLATAGMMKQAEAIRKSGEIRRAQEKADAQAIINQIQDVILVFERRAGDRGQLYGSVTVVDIAEALSEKAQVEVDRRKIRLAEPLRSLGEYEITVRLMVEVEATIRAIVVNEGETYTPPSAEQAAVEAEAEATPEVEVAAEPVVEAVASDTDTAE
jgi:large subunit ribosomal protein L9